MNVCSVGFNPISIWNREADAFPHQLQLCWAWPLQLLYFWRTLLTCLAQYSQILSCKKYAVAVKVSAQVKLFHDFFTSLQWNTALLKSLKHLSVWEAETCFFLWLLMLQSRRARLPRCKLLLFCDVQVRPHLYPSPTYRIYVCMPVYVFASVWYYPIVILMYWLK